MNTFASVLLTFPFYLAIKGRLSVYINLAKPGQTATAPASSTGAGGVTGTQLMNAVITALNITG